MQYKNWRDKTLSFGILTFSMSYFDISNFWYCLTTLGSSFFPSIRICIARSHLNLAMIWRHICPISYRQYATEIFGPFYTDNIHLKILKYFHHFIQKMCNWNIWNTCSILSRQFTAEIFVLFCPDSMQWNIRNIYSISYWQNVNVIFEIFDVNRNQCPRPMSMKSFHFEK